MPSGVGGLWEAGAGHLPSRQEGLEQPPTGVHQAHLGETDLRSFRYLNLPLRRQKAKLESLFLGWKVFPLAYLRTQWYRHYLILRVAANYNLISGTYLFL